MTSNMTYDELVKHDVVIYGAGSAGRLVLDSLKRRNGNVLFFIDDDAELSGHKVDGVVVLSPGQYKHQEPHSAALVFLIALPSVHETRLDRLEASLAHYGKPIYRLSSMYELLTSPGLVSFAKEIPLHSLLGRDEVQIQDDGQFSWLASQTVVVTGAGGSIGSELVRQILNHKPLKIVLVDSSEYSLYSMQQELEGDRAISGVSLCFCLGSVLDVGFLESIFSVHSPDHVFHAAAYKHVPLVQSNPIGGIKNNVVGTLNVVKACLRFQAESFCLISTDKAVRPTNYMGASKRVAELVTQSFGHLCSKSTNPTKFSIVRFGNVLGSSGSVVPLFSRQIRRGGPVTVTDPMVTRYFMTIPEAVNLILAATGTAKGGDVFLLDMGEPIKILDLAKKMVELSGYRVSVGSPGDEGSIQIVFTGLRPGEKLYEELLVEGTPQKTENPKIFKSSDSNLPEGFEYHFGRLSGALDKYQITEIDEILSNLVEDFEKK